MGAVFVSVPVILKILNREHCDYSHLIALVAKNSVFIIKSDERPLNPVSAIDGWQAVCHTIVYQADMRTNQYDKYR